MPGAAVFQMEGEPGRGEAGDVFPPLMVAREARIRLAPALAQGGLHAFVVSLLEPLAMLQLLVEGLRAADGGTGGGIEAIQLLAGEDAVFIILQGVPKHAAGGVSVPKEETEGLLVPLRCGGAALPGEVRLGLLPVLQSILASGFSLARFAGGGDVESDALRDDESSGVADLVSRGFTGRMREVIFRQEGW